MNVNVMQNALKFLERVDAKGMECYAWCEVHASLQQEIREATTPTPVVSPPPAPAEVA